MRVAFIDAHRDEYGSSDCGPWGPRAVVPATRSEPHHYVFVIAGFDVKQGSDQVNSTFEGDLIRPLGLVTLYCGYAE